MGRIFLYFLINISDWSAGIIDSDRITEFNGENFEIDEEKLKL
jgi:hypothetical protein